MIFVVQPLPNVVVVVCAVALPRIRRHKYYLLLPSPRGRELLLLPPQRQSSTGRVDGALRRCKQWQEGRQPLLKAVVEEGRHRADARCPIYHAIAVHVKSQRRRAFIG